jgi:phosphatidylglycerol:prolipoprotein diacylglycerol transferase
MLIAGFLALIAANHGPFIHDISPVIFSLGPFQIRYYGLVYMVGFLLVFYLLRSAARKKTLALGEDDLERFVLLLIAGVVFGARLFEVIIYNPGYYLSHPLEIIQVWKGGLSFHGGLAGVLFFTWIFSRKQGRPSFFTLTDMLVLPALAMLAFGRLANFINGELYGSVTTAAWGVRFHAAEGYRHPTQIYEACKNAFAFGILFFIHSFKPRTGVLTSAFLVAYGAFRFVIEFFKDYGEYGYKTLSLDALNVAHLLCLIMIGVGITGLILIQRRASSAAKRT